MKDDKLNSFFESLDFDVHELDENHQDVFLEKLQNTSAGNSNKTINVISLWKPFMLVAASVTLVILVLGKGVIQESSNGKDLASVSKEMANTQNFYSNLIKSELTKLEAQQSPDTKILIEDTLQQLEDLESDYKQLKKDLANSGEDKRVIYAMVNNFQQRIALLTTVLEQIEEIEKLKTIHNESNIL